MVIRFVAHRIVNRLPLGIDVDKLDLRPSRRPPMPQQVAVAKPADNAADLVRHAVLRPQQAQAGRPEFLFHGYTKPVVDVLAEPASGVAPIGLDNRRELLWITGVD